MSALPHPAHPLDPPPSKRRLSWLLVFPKLAVALLILALITLLWLLQKSDREERHNILVKDVLPVEFISTTLLF